jgi:hypothetical protein
MDNKENNLEFISSESYRQEIDIWYRSFNISREKLNLFHDFVVSIYYMVDETFLGSDVLYDEKNQKEHFTWAWNKVIENFSKEKIHIKNKGTHYEYFWNLFLNAYYDEQIKGEKVKILDYFFRLFDFGIKKTKSELVILTELYKILNQNFKK